MMKCPRCGFDQPEDKFCANCGLNVASFLAKPKPLVQRLLGSALFYVTLIVVAVIMAVSYVRHTDFARAIKSNVPLTEVAPVSVGNKVIEASKTNGSPVNSANSPSAAMPTTNPTAQTAESTTAMGEGIADEATTAATPNGSAGATASTAKPLTQIEAIFYLLSREAWQMINQEGKPAPDQGPFRIMQFASSEKYQPVFSAAKKQLYSKSLSLQPSAVSSLRFPLPGSTNAVPVGLFMDFATIRQEAGQVEVELSGLVDISLAAHNPVRFSIVLNIAPNGLVVINQVLPKKALPETARSAVIGTPLEVLNLPEYTQGSDEVVLAVFGH